MENLSKRLELWLSDLWSEHMGYSREQHAPEPAAHASHPAAAASRDAAGIPPAVAQVLSQ